MVKCGIEILIIMKENGKMEKDMGRVLKYILTMIGTMEIGKTDCKMVMV